MRKTQSEYFSTHLEKVVDSGGKRLNVYLSADGRLALEKLTGGIDRKQSSAVNAALVFHATHSQEAKEADIQQKANRLWKIPKAT